MSEVDPAKDAVGKGLIGLGVALFAAGALWGAWTAVGVLADPPDALITALMGALTAPVAGIFAAAVLSVAGFAVRRSAVS